MGAAMDFFVRLHELEIRITALERSLDTLKQYVAHISNSLSETMKVTKDMGENLQGQINLQKNKSKG